MAVPNWQELAKSPLDPQTIEQAIAAAIDVHNQDPNAHMASEQAIENHRTAEVADHPAESVVNDKIFPVARAYVAIVGSGADGDFATLDEAIDYAAPRGGGNILLLPGEHTVSGVVDIPMSINLIGADRDATFLVLDGGTSGSLRYVEDPVAGQTQALVKDLFIVGAGDVCMSSFRSTSNPLGVLSFENCDFYGGATYIDGAFLSLIFRDCNMEVAELPGIIFGSNLLIENSTIYFDGGGDYATAIDRDTPLAGFGAAIFRDVTFSLTDDPSHPVFEYTDPWYIKAYRCTFEYVTLTSSLPAFWACEDCNFYTEMTGAPSLRSSSSYQTFLRNVLRFDNDGAVLTLNYAAGVIAFNVSNIPIVSSLGAASGYDANGHNLISSIFVHPNSATAMALNTHPVCQLTPNSTRTLTTTVATKGETRTLIILTSGTTSYTLTFGTGFRSTGTLATGTTSGRRYILEFVSDGSRMIEMSRTVAIA